MEDVTVVEISVSVEMPKVPSTEASSSGIGECSVYEGKASSLRISSGENSHC